MVFIDANQYVGQAGAYWVTKATCSATIRSPL
jgi:hypothetical protein